MGKAYAGGDHIMRRGTIFSILKGILLIVFVFLLAGRIFQPTDSDKPLTEISAQTLKNIDMLSMVEKTPNDVKLFLQLNPGDYKEIVYYKSDDVMQPSEILIVHFNSRDQYDAFESAITSHVNSQANIFEGYAPEESSMLSDHILIGRKGYVLFYVGENQEAVASAFSQSL
jgi:hypothetical protein